jgi:hypothetical protein
VAMPTMLARGLRRAGMDINSTTAGHICAAAANTP